jgi:hypothetical protein
MAVKVYFETSGAAEAVAVFDDEEAYSVCLPALEILAKKNGWPLITESIVDEVDMNDIFEFIETKES